jgi:hypothetical protein
MNAKQARRSALHWINSNQPHWPGLVAAHFVGGITTMADDEYFPPTKDLDLHLIFEESSPMLQAKGPFMNILEERYEGVAIEAGVRSMAEYASVEKILGNPEIAHHLTLDSIVDDPFDYLSTLQIGVRAGYRDPFWIKERISYERRGLDAAFERRSPAGEMFGPAGEMTILGYTTTFAKAVLDVGALHAPRIGSRLGVNLGARLESLGRSDLFNETLGFLGIEDVSITTVASWLERGSVLFDEAVAARTTPHPFQHKLYPHLRPHFVDSCQRMFDEGHHREAMWWIIPFIEATTDILLVDGSADRKQDIADTQSQFLQLLNFDKPTARDEKYAQARACYERYFALADELAEHETRTLIAVQ